MAKLKLGEASVPASTSTTPASPLVLDLVGESANGDLICAFREADPAPTDPTAIRTRAIVFAPPPDSPAAFADWLRDDVVPKLAHLPPADIAERVSRIVLEHEQKMFARVAFHVGRILKRQGSGVQDHTTDLAAIINIVTAPAPAPVPAVVPTDDTDSQIEQQPAAEAPALGIQW